MTPIEKLLKHIQSGALIRALTIPDGDVFSTLDARDEHSFSLKWMDAFRAIEAAKTTAGPRSEDATTVNAIREAAYLQSYTRWKSPELASYISDDFDLIADAITVDSADQWIAGLLREYLSGRVPVAGLGSAEGSIARQLDQLSAD